MNRWLLAFDVRQQMEHYVSRRWDAAARTRYLLRPDIRWPLSVDPRVWPSVFSSGVVGRVDLSAPPNIEGDPDTKEKGWGSDLGAVRTYFDRHRARVLGGVFIAIELLSEKHAEAGVVSYVLPEGIECGFSLERTSPERLPEGATFLGYDVANIAWISGLSNTAYTDEELRDLKPRWADRLNSVGLFDAVENAVGFRQVCDERDRGSAPFWIYGLWRLPFD